MLDDSRIVCGQVVHGIIDLVSIVFQDGHVFGNRLSSNPGLYQGRKPNNARESQINSTA